MGSLAPDFVAALRLLSRADARYDEASGRRAVIVGGAAVSFYTEGAILAGDVDLGADIGFGEALLAEGFRRGDRRVVGQFEGRIPTRNRRSMPRACVLIADIRSARQHVASRTGG